MTARASNLGASATGTRSTVAAAQPHGERLGIINDNLDITGIVASAHRSWSVPGISVTVVRRDTELALIHSGYSELAGRTEVCDSSVFQIGSISKSFTAFVIAQLAEQGRIGLGDPVTNYLPWFEVDSQAAPITIRSLLNHTAGLIACMDGIPDAIAQAAAARQMPLGCAPGEWFHYSNVGYAVLGLVAESITGASIGENVQRLLLDPLSMKHSHRELTHEARLALATGYVPLFDDRPFLPGEPLIPAPWFEFAAGDGNIAATARDMGRYARMLLGHGALEGRQVIDGSAFDHVIGDRAVPGDGDRPGRYGLGFNVEHEDRLVLSHGGGMVGYSSHLIADLTLDLGVVVLSNAPGESAAARTIAWNIVEAYRSGSVHERVLPDRTVIGSADRYTGRFSDGRNTIEVSTRPGGRLRLTSAGATGDLYETGHGYLACDHPAWRHHQHRIVNTHQSRSWTVGPYVLAEDGASPPLVAPETAHPLAGNYRSYSPWFPSFRIVQRGDDLILCASVGVEADMSEPLLVDLGNGVYRIGVDAHLPERLVCGPTIDGQVAWVDRDLCRYTRSFRA